MAELGLDAFVHDPLLTRRGTGRLRWSLRELSLPFELGAADVALPQRRDGYPYGSEGGGLTALLEAMAMGRPLVATGRAILRDYVADGDNALIVPPEDPAALRAAIERVLGDRALAERLGAA